MAAANRYRRRIVSFRTELEGMIPTYGDLIAVAHDMPRWGESGEVVAYDPPVLTLSEPVTFNETGTHSIVLRRRDGSLSGPWRVSQGQSEKRPMMGQSPYIVNGGVYYQNDSIGLQCSILYNVIGPRIFIVGSYGAPDVYEMPRNSLDISLSKTLWKKLEIKVGVHDLLNQKYLLSQDANMDGKITRNDQQIQSYKRGSYYSIGISFKF